jgi:uncharacterized protein involved in outer membrane biogenesis
MPSPRLWKTLAVLPLAVLVLAGAALAWWLPSDEELAARVASSASEALGVPVTVGAIEWGLLPTPHVVLLDAATRQPQPLRLRRLEVRPRLWPLLSGRVELARVVLDGGHIEQRSLQGLGTAPSGQDRPMRPGTLELGRVEFRELTWVSRTGVAAVFEGEADVEPGLRLARATVRRPGAQPAADIVITRDTAEPDSAVQDFRLQVRLGGGTADGRATVEIGGEGRLRLRGRLSPRGVELQAALGTFNRRSPVRGAVSGETTLDAEGANPLVLAQQLHTRTRFTMAPATLMRFDLDRAVRSLGREHQGQTAIEELTGQLDTQNTPDGIVMRFTDLKARAGAFTATGQARLANRRVSATAAVDLVDGLVGVPVSIEGPLGSLKVTVSKAPLVGAAVGTAVLPGIGTAIGAAIGRMLGGAEAPAKPASQP